MANTTTLVINKSPYSTAFGSSFVAEGAAAGSGIRIEQVAYYAEYPSGLVTYNGNPVVYNGNTNFVIYTA